MQTHSDIVRNAGKETEIAELCGVTIYAVRSWRARDSIPGQHWAAFANAGHATLEQLANAASRATQSAV